MPDAADVQAKTLDDFIKGWHGWTPEGFLASWTDDCKQKTLPFSYDIPERSRADYETMFPLMMSYLSNFQLKVHNIVHDVPHRKAAIYASATADSPMGPYTNEHALFLWLNESGDKVERIEEMLDENAMKDFQPKFEKYIAQQQSQSQSQS